MEMPSGPGSLPCRLLKAKPGFRVYDLGFWVLGLGFGVKDLEFRA